MKIQKSNWDNSNNSPNKLKNTLKIFILIFNHQEKKYNINNNNTKFIYKK